MSMLEPSREETLAPGSTRSFGLTFAAVGIIAAGICALNGVALWVVAVLGLAGLGFALAAFTAGRALAPFNRAWFRFGMLLSKLTQPILLGIVFFLVITPIGLVRRVLGADPMRLRAKRGRSHWIDREENDADGAGSMTRQF